MSPMPMTNEELVRRIWNEKPCSAEIVDEYYTRCIPVYREFLGNHWHTGYYLQNDKPIGPEDQRRMERRIARSVKLDRRCEVLDVGCGIGGPACYLAEFTGATIRGLTPNRTQWKIARSLAVKAKVTDRVNFDNGFASELPYPDQSFDVVLFFESPCHFPDRNQFFREAFRVLRPGGRVAGEDWLISDGLNSEQVDRFIRPIHQTWAIPKLGTRQSYNAAMADAGLIVMESVDMRDEMALVRGFAVTQTDRDELRDDARNTPCPIRALIMEGLLRLGEAVAAECFTIGRFLAIKPE